MKTNKYPPGAVIPRDTATTPAIASSRRYATVHCHDGATYNGMCDGEPHHVWYEIGNYIIPTDRIRHIEFKAGVGL